MPWPVSVLHIAHDEMRHGRHGRVQALVIQDAEPPLLSGHLIRFAEAALPVQVKCV